MSATTDTSIGFADMLDVLGFIATEFVSLGYEDTAGIFHTAVMSLPDAIANAAKIPTNINAYFGACPTKGPARLNSGRGREEACTRLSGLWCDIDVKPGACPSIAVAEAIIAELGILLGTRPSIIVRSGSGLHAYWPISDGQIVNGAVGPARALVKRWGRLVAHVAGRHNVSVDPVYELARMMRIVGSHNNKASSNGQAAPLVTAQREPGGPLTMAEVDAQLTAYGVVERPEDSTAASTTPVSAPAGWAWATRTCPYIARMIASWPTDRPRNGDRNPWVYGLHVRLACAHRNGCITQADYDQARRVLAELLGVLVATTGVPRKVRKYEIADMVKYGTERAAVKTDEQVSAELGRHPCVSWQTFHRVKASR